MTPEHSVLIVEEDARARKRWTAALEGLRLRVVDSGDFDRAYQLFVEHPSTVVIVSLRQGGTAVAFINRLCAQDSDVSIVAVADTKTSSKVLIEAAQAGAAGFISKPVSAIELCSLASRMALSAESKKQAPFPPGTVLDAYLKLCILSKSAAIAAALKVIASAVSGVADRMQLNRFVLAIDEALSNAHEHGNLNISSAEKTEACESETYEKLVAEREVDAAAEGKRIWIELKCSPNQVCCNIEDEGLGFDWRTVSIPEESGKVALHGRWLLLIHNVFESVTYNDKGNKVTLLKQLG